MTEAAVLLLGFLVFMAYRKEETFLWITAGGYAGLVSPLWWDESSAYGLAAFLVSGICIYKAISQLITGENRF